MKTTLTSGKFQRRELSTEFKEGQGWSLKMETFWKGESEGEQMFAGKTWRDSESEAEKDLEKMTRDLESTGWTKE